jgi:hypothetical protein
MSATLLQLIQQATGEMGLAVPTVVTGSTNADTIQQLALLNAVGYELLRQHPWQALLKAKINTPSYSTLTGDTTIASATVSNITTAGIDTTYAISGTGVNQGTYVDSIIGGTSLAMTQLATATATGTSFTLSKVKFAMPADYDRPVDRTQWDKVKHWEMLGPETPQQWEWLISGYISTGPRIRFRIVGNKFEIWPPITSTTEQFGFNYISSYWVADTTGTAKGSFTADTDTCIFPDRLMVLGLKKKYFEVKGFDAGAYVNDFATELDIAKANDTGSPTLAMSPRLSNVLINWTQIPDSGYGT